MWLGHSFAGSFVMWVATKFLVRAKWENFIFIWESGVGEWQPCVSQVTSVNEIINSDCYRLKLVWTLAMHLKKDLTASHPHPEEDSGMLLSGMWSLVAAILMHAWFLLDLVFYFLLSLNHFLLSQHLVYFSMGSAAQSSYSVNFLKPTPIKVPKMTWLLVFLLLLKKFQAPQVKWEI